MAARIGVSMMPGETQFTRTGASSSARLRASDSIAPFAAPTIAELGRGRMLRKPGDQGERTAGADFGGARDAPGAPELAFHGRAHVFHGYGFERAGAELRGGDHHMIDRAAGFEKIERRFHRW